MDAQLRKLVFVRIKFGPRILKSGENRSSQLSKTSHLNYLLIRDSKIWDKLNHSLYNDFFPVSQRQFLQFQQSLLSKKTEFLQAKTDDMIHCGQFLRKTN